MRVSIAALIVLMQVFGGVAGAVTIETVPVGNPGNAGDTQSQGTFGAVSYEYNIGKYEITAGQYAEFLNAVAGADTYGLYSSDMASSSYGCKIQQSGSSPNYTYSVAADYADRPVNYVSWGDAARFANWLHNGQPTGAQDLTTTEDGAYFLNGATSVSALMAITRETDAIWFIPTEDEWYKAAYYDGASYYDYPTKSNISPGYVDDSLRLIDSGASDVGAFGEPCTDPDGNFATFDGDGGVNGIGSPYYRTEVGEWEFSDSPYGTFDQGGNVWEWTETPFAGTSGRNRRGGSFFDRDTDLHASHRVHINPTWEDGGLGFRVATVPEPSSLSLGLALLLLGLLFRRRRHRS